MKSSIERIFTGEAATPQFIFVFILVDKQRRL